MLRSRPFLLRRLRLAAAIAAATLTLVTACSGRGADNASGGSGSGGNASGPIVIGGVFPFSGPFATFGTLSKGVQTYVNKVNATGGINGRQLRYTAMDYAYDPQRLQDDARQLVQQDHVASLLSFGVPNLSIRDYMNQQQVPHFVLSGNAPFSQVDKYPYTHAWWPDIAWEDTILTKYLMGQNPQAKIGLLGLANDLSDSQKTGIERAGGTLVKDLRVAPNTVDLSSQVSELRAAGVDTLFFTFAGPGQINTLKYMAQIGYRPTLVLYSGADAYTSVLQPAGVDTVSGAYSAHWLKDPADPQWANDADMSAYRQDVQKYGGGADPNDELMANGYGAMAAVVQALRDSRTLKPTDINKAWNAISGTKLNVLIPGGQLNAGPQGRLVYDYQIVRFQDGSWKPQGPVINALQAGVAK